MKYWTRKTARVGARKALAELTTMLKSIEDKYGMTLGSDEDLFLSYIERASMSRPYENSSCFHFDWDGGELRLEEDLKKNRLKETALGKLSKEEKEALGLN